MTRSDGRRQRIVRVRTAEQRIAQQQLAEAQRSAGQISSVMERIDALAVENKVIAGAANGASLAAISEMAARLETARRSTAAPMNHALLQIERRQASSSQAHAKLEGANRLLEKSERENAKNLEKQESANRCFRPPNVAGVGL